MVVRVAVVQATPVVLDGPASVAKACGLIAQAAAEGAKLIALPEGFVPLMPRSCWGHRYAVIMSKESVALHRRLWENSVDVGGALAAALGDAARRAEAWVAVGVNERDADRPGTLWNTLLWFAPDGRLAGRHRKLVPTMHERVFWGQGAGDDLDVIPSELGRLGGLICWENFMPAARRRLHRGGVDFYLAPTADDREIWAAAMRTFAFEAGAFVLSPVQYLRLGLPRRLPASRGPRRVPGGPPFGREPASPTPGAGCWRGRCTGARRSSWPTATSTSSSRRAARWTPPGTTTAPTWPRSDPRSGHHPVAGPGARSALSSRGARPITPVPGSGGQDGRRPPTRDERANPPRGGRKATGALRVSRAANRPGRRTSQRLSTEARCLDSRARSRPRCSASSPRRGRRGRT